VIGRILCANYPEEAFPRLRLIVKLIPGWRSLRDRAGIYLLMFTG
jgi:hypothetical protein